MTVKQLLRSMDSAELTEWHAWMIIQREHQQPSINPPMTGGELEAGVDHQLMKVFGRRD